MEREEQGKNQCLKPLALQAKVWGKVGKSHDRTSIQFAFLSRMLMALKVNGFKGLDLNVSLYS
jgi:hypothetical protein